MIKKLFSKYFLEVIPSIVATVVGAYIVTHYINAKSDTDKPKTAVSVPADTSKNVPVQTLKADEAGDRPATAAKAEAARLKAEKLAAEKVAAERAAADRAENAKKAAEKLASEKAEKAAAADRLAADKAAAEKIASDKAAAEKRERERTTAKAAIVAPAPAAEANAAPERDANDLARAAIERLRKSSPQPVEQPRTQEAARTEEPARPQPERAKVNSVVYAPAAPQPPIQPLLPAVNVAPAPPELAVATPPAPFPRPIDSSSADDDGARLTPPADIPARQAEQSRDRNRSVAEGVVSAARSVFHAVIPERAN